MFLFTQLLSTFSGLGEVFGPLEDPSSPHSHEKCQISCLRNISGFQISTKVEDSLVALWSLFCFCYSLAMLIRLFAEESGLSCCFSCPSIFVFCLKIWAQNYLSFTISLLCWPCSHFLQTPRDYAEWVLVFSQKFSSVCFHLPAADFKMF